MLKLRYAACSPRPEKNISGHFIYEDYKETHIHDYYEFHVFFEGTYTHLLNGEKERVGRGDAFLIRPNDAHNLLTNGNDVCHINIMIKSEYMKKICESYSPTLLSNILKAQNVKVSLTESQINSIAEYVSYLNKDQITAQLYKFYSFLLITTIFNIIIDEKFIEGKNYPQWLSTLLNDIHKKENISWDVKDVLARSPYSHSHLIREFKKYLKCSIVEYLTNVKITASIDYLKHSNKSIAEISTLLGYSSVSHLNHIFKEVTGKSPLQYRKDQFNK